MIDDAIRAALRNADADDKLDIVALTTGYTGGEEGLRAIMEGGEISLVDRIILGGPLEVQDE